MWYVVQVRTGTEESIVSQCRKIIPSDAMEKCFLSYYKEQKKFHGKWHTLEKLLFPGYVFMISDTPDRLFTELKKVNGLTKILTYGDDMIPLTEEEVAFLLRFGKEEQVVEMSSGIIEGNKVIVTDGPLKGLEGCIKKIDRHKRKAWLEVEMFGRMVEMTVGLEIVEKR